MEAQTQHVVILGGGYAGQMAASRLAHQRLPLRITLIDANDQFVERIRLHQVATGQPIPRRPMTAMLPKGVTFRQGRAVALDPVAQTITLETLAGREQVRYDWLVYALGSTVDTSAVPGIAEYAQTLGSAALADRLHEALGRVGSEAEKGSQHLPPLPSNDRARLLVVGGGLTAIEAATELAESYPSLKVTLLTAGELGVGLSRQGATYLRSVFARLGITIREGARVTEVMADAVRLQDGVRVPFELCVWASGFRVPVLAREAGLPVNSQGRIVTDATLRVPVFPNILVAGDAAEARGSDGDTLRMACAVAMPEGIHVAKTLRRLVRGEAPQPFRFGFAVRCISLGRHAGLLQIVNLDDSPREMAITGRMGAWAKEIICRYTVFGLTTERHGLAAFWWPQPAMQTGQGETREEKGRQGTIGEGLAS